ncbi:hypothetical protein EGY31_17825 [Burkholderia multivorans]|nr:hypothetical protein EGY31_17825 [Burkholderia multivorans]
MAAEATRRIIVQRADAIIVSLTRMATGAKMSDNFDDFIRKQVRSSADEGKPLDLTKEKQTWLTKLDELYELVRVSLREYIDDGSINMEVTDFLLHEQLLGSYTAKAARIMVGRQVVTLKPVGTFLIGARGRVDMTGPRGITKFVIVPPNAERVRVTITEVKPGDQPKPAEPSAPPETWVWKISTPPPRITYTELNAESFRTALMGVMGDVNG